MKNLCLLFENFEVQNWTQDNIDVKYSAIHLSELYRVSGYPQILRISKDHSLAFSHTSPKELEQFNKNKIAMFSSIEEIVGWEEKTQMRIYPFVFNVKNLQPIPIKACSMKFEKKPNKIIFKLSSSTSSSLLIRHRIACIDMDIIDMYGLPKFIYRWKSKVEVELDDHENTILIDVKTFENVEKLQEYLEISQNDICVLPFLIYPGGIRDVRRTVI